MQVGETVKNPLPSDSGKNRTDYRKSFLHIHRGLMPGPPTDDKLRPLQSVLQNQILFVHNPCSFSLSVSHLSTNSMLNSTQTLCNTIRTAIISPSQCQECETYRQQAATIYPPIPSSLLLDFFFKIILVAWLEVATCQWTVHQLMGDVSRVCGQRQILCCSGAFSALQLRQADDGSTQGLYG